MKRSQTGRFDREGFSSLQIEIMRIRAGGLHRSRERRGQRMRRHNGAVGSGCEAGLGGKTCNREADYAKREGK